MQVSVFKPYILQDGSKFYVVDSFGGSAEVDSADEGRQKIVNWLRSLDPESPASQFKYLCLNPERIQVHS